MVAMMKLSACWLRSAKLAESDKPLVDCQRERLTQHRLCSLVLQVLNLVLSSPQMLQNFDINEQAVNERGKDYATKPEDEVLDAAKVNAELQVSTVCSFDASQHF